MYVLIWASLVTQMVKNLPAMWFDHWVGKIAHVMQQLSLRAAKPESVLQSLCSATRDAIAMGEWKGIVAPTYRN